MNIIVIITTIFPRATFYAVTSVQRDSPLDKTASSGWQL